MVTALGFASKFYAGPGAGWVHGHLGGVFYEAFWILLLVLARPSISLWLAVSVVFILTCALEFLQLWHPPFLTVVRGTFLGHALIGTTFAWSDFPHYVAGCVAGVLIVRAASGSNPPSAASSR